MKSPKRPVERKQAPHVLRARFLVAVAVDQMDSTRGKTETVKRPSRRP